MPSKYRATLHCSFTWNIASGYLRCVQRELLLLTGKSRNIYIFWPANPWPRLSIQRDVHSLVVVSERPGSGALLEHILRPDRVNWLELFWPFFIFSFLFSPHSFLSFFSSPLETKSKMRRYIRWIVTFFFSYKQKNTNLNYRLRIKPIICIAKCREELGIRPNLAVFPLSVHGQSPYTVFFDASLGNEMGNDFRIFSPKFRVEKQNKKPALIPTDIFVVLFLAFSVRDRVAAVSMIYESRVVGCRELHQLSLCVSAAQRKENNQNIPHNRNVMCVCVYTNIRAPFHLFVPSLTAQRNIWIINRILSCWADKSWH